MPLPQGNPNSTLSLTPTHSIAKSAWRNIPLHSAGEHEQSMSALALLPPRVESTQVILWRLLVPLLWSASGSAACIHQHPASIVAQLRHSATLNAALRCILVRGERFSAVEAHIVTGTASLVSPGRH
jgi:hypothetical protein